MAILKILDVKLDRKTLRERQYFTNYYNTILYCKDPKQEGLNIDFFYILSLKVGDLRKYPLSYIVCCYYCHGFQCMTTTLLIWDY